MSIDEPDRVQAPAGEYPSGSRSAPADDPTLHPGQRAERVLDLFAGPGGWDVGASYLGIAPLGIELDESACATRSAAKLRTLPEDVAAFKPEHVMCAFDGPLDGLIASPPCQSFSMAGKRGGEQDTEHVIACAHELAAGNDTRAEHRAKCEDERSMLVVEPLRWVRDLRPRWVALEQVPPVLGLWTLFAQLTQTWGYKTWVGILSAERYGVPQTRKRAILLASLDFQPHPPEPTHQAYVPGEPQRHEVTMFGEILPWVSMAEALGWTEGERPTPAPTVTGGGTAQGGVEVFASKAARQRARGAVTHYSVRPSERGGNIPRSVDDPAPTVCAEALKKGRDVWMTKRSSTTVNGDPRIFEPGWRGSPDDYAEDGTYTGKRAGDNAIRVSVQEASILQSFPPDYPWQGSRSAQFQQIGNAVPPKLACAVLRQLAQDRVPVTTGIEAA